MIKNLRSALTLASSLALTLALSPRVALAQQGQSYTPPLSLGSGVATALAPGASGSFTVQNGVITVGDCLKWSSSGVQDAGACGGGLTVGTTPITSGVSGRIEYNNSGVLGELATTGSGNVVLATSPSLVTPALGAATGTSLALGGATLGSNALACPIHDDLRLSALSRCSDFGRTPWLGFFTV